MPDLILLTAILAPVIIFLFVEDNIKGMSLYHLYLRRLRQCMPFLLKGVFILFTGDCRYIKDISESL